MTTRRTFCSWKFALKEGRHFEMSKFREDIYILYCVINCTDIECLSNNHAINVFHESIINACINAVSELFDKDVSEADCKVILFWHNIWVGMIVLVMVSCLR